MDPGTVEPTDDMKSRQVKPTIRIPIHSVAGYLVCQRGSKNSSRDLKIQIFLVCLVHWKIPKTGQMKLFQFFHLSDNKATGKPGQLVLVKNSLIHLKMDLNIVKPNNMLSLL